MVYPAYVLTIFALTLGQPNPPSSFDPGTLVIVAIAAIGLILALFALWRGRTLVRRTMAAGASTCGQCGYGVTGLPSFTCPECGSDLRDVGIVHPKKSEPPTPVVSRIKPLRDAWRLMAVLALWTLIYALLYACIGTGSYPRQPWDSGNRPVLYGVVDGFLWPYRGKSTHTVSLEPQSEAYRRFILTEQREATFQGWRNAPVVRWTGDTPSAGLTHFDISLQLDTLNGKSATLEVDPADLSWRYVDPRNPANIRAGPALDGTIVWGWMMQNGVDQPSQTVKDEADTIVDIISQSIHLGTVGGSPIATGRLENIVARQRDAVNPAVQTYPFRASRGTAIDVYGPAWSIYWLSVPFGLGVYSYGTNWLWGRNRKRIAGSTKPTEG